MIVTDREIKELQDQAVKEFAEKLKKKARGLTLEGDKGPGFYIGNIVLTNDIDKLLEEYDNDKQRIYRNFN